MISFISYEKSRCGNSSNVKNFFLFAAKLREKKRKVCEHESNVLEFSFLYPIHISLLIEFIFIGYKYRYLVKGFNNILYILQKKFIILNNYVKFNNTNIIDFIFFGMITLKLNRNKIICLTLNFHTF